MAKQSNKFYMSLHHVTASFAVNLVGPVYMSWVRYVMPGGPKMRLHVACAISSQTQYGVLAIESSNVSAGSQGRRVS